MAYNYIAQKNYEKAITVVDEVISENSNYIWAYSLGAKASLALGKLDLTKEYAQNAISLDINYADGYYYLALVRFEEKDFDEAVECMKRAIIYDVNNDEYYAQMSKIYKAKEDFKTALEYIKEAENISGKEEYRIACKELANLCRKK